MNSKTPCIAVFGTGSDVGKSIIATALCRYFKHQNIRVVPFKAQNMSNNSGVTPEGLEMGRAQIVQAEAAKLPPAVDMNPILLKPSGGTGPQVIRMGQVYEYGTTPDHAALKKTLFQTACRALDRLKNQYELVVMEGAGSCAEVNLLPDDIVNFPMAEYAEAKVILTADIDKGGVFGQIIGTLECLPQKYRDRIAGFIINRFRGDVRLFEEGKKWIEQKTGKPVFGALPWYHHFHIEAEDSVVIENPDNVNPTTTPGKSAIAVIRIPHISNFTDVDPLTGIDGLAISFMEQPKDLSLFNAVILPGSKNTRFDLKWLKSVGWFEKILNYKHQGGHLLGICGGYQMMGKTVYDPDGIEGEPGTTKGLDILPVETILSSPKTTTLTRFLWDDITGSGYEIHMGQTKRQGGAALFQVSHRNDAPVKDDDGCKTDDSKVMGTYIHGLFDTPRITKKWLDAIGITGLQVPDTHGFSARQRQYDLLEKHFVQHVDMNRICDLIHPA
jgi:adenosylcobyric acid synthase